MRPPQTTTGAAVPPPDLTGKPYVVTGALEAGDWSNLRRNAYSRQCRSDSRLNALCAVAEEMIAAGEKTLAKDLLEKGAATLGYTAKTTFRDESACDEAGMNETDAYVFRRKDYNGCMHMTHLLRLFFLVVFVGSMAGNLRADEPVDMNRARELLKIQKRGGQLTEEEQAYIDQARSIRNRQRTSPAGATQTRTGGQRGAFNIGRTSSGIKPLCDMSATQCYGTEDGGLYGNGRNCWWTVPREDRAHRSGREIKRNEPGRYSTGDWRPRG